MARPENWSKLLELHLRQNHGTAFQAFVNKVFGRIHGDNFVPIRADGPKGDKGLDGFLAPGGTVYQCYGAENGKSNKSSNVCKKMVADYQKARKSRIDLRAWKFTHNMVDGLTADMAITLDELTKQGEIDGVEVGHFGLEGFRSLLRNMTDEDCQDIIGFMESSDVDKSKLPTALDLVIEDLIKSFGASIDKSDGRWLVPADKLAYNDIPAAWRIRMRQYYAFSPEVNDSMATVDSDTVVAGIRHLYQDFRRQGLGPSDILHEMHAAIMGRITKENAEYREPAAMAVLATMFEVCVIFEENPVSKSTVPIHDPAH
ncbi:MULTISPECIES: hypothetical protein [unclassified Ensifer]|uniref:hypothetical protein n=1 Tax=unclassified Ensifer TaxID=2633371 RepID=UPI00081318F3|nr:MULTISPECIES: hypothetical protein [unclassified Ensifer]OCP01294.1 hypothetical protein BC362_22935 [Ensifer sp. LC14]OCP03556.1 hypothetical protein BC374_06115 [Ensifer sp. LC13]OCP33969.1 hypothetical protein BC364_13605 [Ensifer sp. LC499]